MRRLTFYPTLQEALYLHEKLIQEFGGKVGVRDLGLLESSLSRPKSGYYETLAEQGAALFQSLAMNHCFIDGNKRVAFALTAVFFQLNGFFLKVGAKEGERFIVQNAIVNKLDVAGIATWFERRLKKLS